MARLAGYSKSNRRRDQRRPVPLPATLDGVPVMIVDLSLSGVGAGTVEEEAPAKFSLRPGQLCRIEFTDAREREVSVLLEITYFLASEGRFGGRFEGLSGEDFDVIQDLMLRRHSAAAAE